MFKKKSDDLSKYLQENAPSIAFWVAALILITFDIHVVDVMWNITSSYLLAAGSLFSTGVMFFVWKNNFQYTLSSRTQVFMSTVGMVISLGASAVFGGMDFFVKAGLSIDTGAQTLGSKDLILWGVPILSITHVVMLLLYWYLDPVVSADRKIREADDDAQFAEREMVHAENLLSRSTSVFATFAGLANTYGREAAIKQLENLGLDRALFENVEIEEKPAMTGHGKEPEPAMTGWYGQGLSSMTPHPGHGQPVNPAMTGNGNGHKPENPTTAGSAR